MPQAAAGGRASGRRACCRWTSCRAVSHLQRPCSRLLTAPRAHRHHPALPSSGSQPPKDALDTMCLGAVDLDGLDVYTMVDHQPFDPTIKRTESVRACCLPLERPAGWLGCCRWATAAARARQEHRTAA